MSSHLILLVGLIFTFVTIEQFVKGNIGTALCFLGGAIGQFGFYLITIKK